MAEAAQLQKANTHTHAHSHTYALTHTITHTHTLPQLQQASDERGERVVALRDSIKSMESGSQEALSSASEHRKVAAELQGQGGCVGCAVGCLCWLWVASPRLAAKSFTLFVVCCCNGVVVLL